MMNLSIRAEPQPRGLARDPEQARIKIHGAEGFEGMRRAGRLAAEVLDFITPQVQPGITTDALDRLCHDFIVSHGDTSRMFLVGDKVPLKARRLVDVTYEAMMIGIEQVKPGIRVGAIGHAIQSLVES